MYKNIVEDRIKQMMANFPIKHYRFFNDPQERYFGDQLNLFDPWHDFEAFQASLPAVPNTFRWINEPHRSVARRSAAAAAAAAAGAMSTASSSSSSSSSSYYKSTNNFPAGSSVLPSLPNPIVPIQSEKFRVQLDITGFKPETIRTRIDGRKVIVEAKQEEYESNGDFSTREIRKTYDLPEHADAANLASFVTPDNMLVIEVPINLPVQQPAPILTLSDPHVLAPFGQYRDPVFDYHGFMGSEFRPRIVDIGNGQKQVQLSLSVNNYRPEQIRVSVKNNELLVQAEHIYNDNNRSERSFLTKSILLPPGTQIEQIHSFLSNEGQLNIEAPFIEPLQVRSIPVYHS